MLRVALTGLRGHAVRLLLTGCAVVVGIGFLAGTLVYGDTATAAFYDDLARPARHVDVSVRAWDDGRDRVPAGYLDRIRGVPGVTTVEGRYREELPLLTPDGRLIADGDGVGVVLSLPGSPALAAYGVAAGRLPGAPGEVAVDRTTAQRHGFTLGGPVRALDRDGTPHPLTLVGLLDLGVNRRWFGLSVTVLGDADLLRLTRPTGYAEIVTIGGSRDGVHAVVGDDYRVATGAQVRRELARQAAKYVDEFLAVLIAFGLVALTVAGFVIYNTFAILAAQRARELALLRCVGATRRQVTGAVLVEAVLLGLAGSVAGLLASVLVGYGLLAAREAVGAPIPDHPPVLRPNTVALALGLGLLLTTACALVPAVRAGRTAPLASLRAGTPLAARRRVWLATVLCGLSTMAVLVGVRYGFAGLPLVLGGAMLGFVALVVVGPLVVGPVIGVAARSGAPVLRLAGDNARRSPHRTSAVATALLIGVALMSLLSVLLATARTQSTRELTENFPVDFVLSRARFTAQTALPAGLADALRARPQVGAVSGVRIDETWAADRPVTAWALLPDPSSGVAVRASAGGPARPRHLPEVTDGSLDRLGPGTAALARSFAARAGLRVGDRVPMPTGSPVVVALYDDSPVAAEVLLPWESFGAGEPDRLLVDAAAGSEVSIAEARRALDEVLRDHPLVLIQTLADARGALDATLDELLGIFAALLGLSVGIAVFGIGNTLTLAVRERTRESAVLRALGMSRAQVRGMLLVEAGLTAAVGAAGGVLFGTGVGWVAATGLIRSYGHGAPTVPLGQVLLFAALAVVVALLAGVLPGRRAARTPIVATLARDSPG